MNPTPICFITDTNYLLATRVAIESLCRSRGDYSDFRVVVFSDGLSEEDKQSLMQVDGNTEISVDVVDVSLEGRIPRLQSGNAHVSSAALIKFLLPELLPQDKTALYLDSDILVRDDLKDLLDTDVSSDYAAMTETFSAALLTPNPNEYLGLDNYYNTGVMLLNLEAMRTDGITDRLIEYRVNGQNRYMDQDAFNAVLTNRIVPLSILNNFMYSTIAWYSSSELCQLYYLDGYGGFDALYAAATIVHYSSPNKPWNDPTLWHVDDWLQMCAQAGCDAPEEYDSSNRLPNLPTDDNNATVRLRGLHSANSQLHSRFDKLTNNLEQVTATKTALETCVQAFREDTTLRFDLKIVNEELPETDMELLNISDCTATVKNPLWFQDGGKGYVIESCMGSIEFSLKALCPGELQIVVRGMDVRDSDGNQLKKWVRCEDLQVNSVRMLPEPRAVWHNNGFTTLVSVDSGDTVTISATWGVQTFEPEYIQAVKSKDDLQSHLQAQIKMLQQNAIRAAKVRDELQREYVAATKALARAEKRLEDLKHSKAYRLGLTLAQPYRKLRKVVGKA